MEADFAAARRVGGPPMRLRKDPAHFPARPVNASAAKWRVSRCFKRKSPASFALTGLLTPQLRDWRRSGDQTQSGFCGLADDPPQFGCNAVEHGALLLHPLGVVVI